MALSVRVIERGFARVHGVEEVLERHGTVSPPRSPQRRPMNLARPREGTPRNRSKAGAFPAVQREHAVGRKNPQDPV